MRIVKESRIEKSFRNQAVIGQFDLQISENIQEEFDLDFSCIPEEWKLGVIVGNSGTGKTTIGKEIFHLDINNAGYDHNKSVIDSFPKETKLEEITKMLTLVGFASPKSWLKSYGVLSNGEKMRVDLALELLNNKKEIVFDEFTSVVDREVAKTMCLVINKLLPIINKKIVLISCHFDILNYLDTDWIFNTNSMILEIDKKKDFTENWNCINAIEKYGDSLASTII